MNERRASVYRCPYTKESLTLDVRERNGADIVTGTFLAPSGARYPIEDGIPSLISAEAETPSERQRHELAYYESTGDAYDRAIDWLFESFYAEEAEVRDEMLSVIDASRVVRALEIGCGTCRDSVRMARRLAGGAELFLQDLSPRMILLGRDRMRRSGPFKCAVEYFVGDGAHLPFPDQFFDVAFHFGGLNLFADTSQALAEISRVVRVGGQVLVGDEGMAPWLRETAYGQILLNSNPLYKHEAPLKALPRNAMSVRARWVLGNAFYLIDFIVGAEGPRVNLDLPIVGRRGGTHRTRFYGTLEGVTVEAREIAERAARESGLSLHEWLDRAVRMMAARESEP